MTTLSDSQRARQPKGSPTGGQYAAMDRPEADDLDLTGNTPTATPVSVVNDTFISDYEDWVNDPDSKLSATDRSLIAHVVFQRDYGIDPIDWTPTGTPTLPELSHDDFHTQDPATGRTTAVQHLNERAASVYTNMSAAANGWATYMHENGAGPDPRHISEHGWATRRPEHIMAAISATLNSNKDKTAYETGRNNARIFHTALKSQEGTRQ